MTRLIFVAAFVVLASSRALFGQALPPAVPPSDPQPLPPIVTAPQPVAGQPRPERPYRGLFGGGDPGETPGFGLLIDVFAGHDSNLTAVQPGVGDRTQPFARLAGGFAGGAASLSYLHARGDTVFTLLARSEARHFPRIASNLTHSHGLSAGLSFDVGRNFHLVARGGVDYSSFYQLSHGLRTAARLPAVPAEAPSFDSRLGPVSTFGYDTDVEARQNVGPRSEMRYFYRRRRTEYRLDSRRFGMQGAGASYVRHMTRYAALQLGYGFTQTNYGLGQPAEVHDLDIGVTYDRPLSFSRRTRVGMAIGSQAFSREEEMLYRVQGSARLTHEIGRTWMLAGVYHRGAQFVDAVPEPLYADTVTVSLGGLLAGRRLHLRTHGAYSTGELTLTTRRRGLVTYSGAAELLWALNERWAAHGNYGYYYSEFGPGLRLPAYVVGAPLGRHSVSGGVKVWLPLSMQRGHRGTR